MGPKWKIYEDAKRAKREAADWLSHIGKKGRVHDGHVDILELSIAHANLKLVIAGQYSNGGQNYHDSPKSFNAALLSVIHDDFDNLSKRAMAKLVEAETQSLIDAKGEIEGVLSDISKAEATLAA